MLAAGSKSLSIARKQIPILISHRIPQRKPPVLAFPTRESRVVLVGLKESNASSITIEGNVSRTIAKRLKTLFETLKAEVLPGPLSLTLRVEDSAYRLGLLAAITHQIVLSLESYYKEEFTCEDRKEITSQLIAVHGVDLNEARALAHAIEHSKPALYSMSEGAVVLEGEPIDVRFLKRIRVKAQAESPPGILLDYAAKLSSYVIVQLLEAFLQTSRERLVRGEGVYAMRASNSLWHILYGVKLPSKPVLLLPSLPGELVGVEIK